MFVSDMILKVNRSKILSLFSAFFEIEPGRERLKIKKPL